MIMVWGYAVGRESKPTPMYFNITQHAVYSTPRFCNESIDLVKETLNKDRKLRLTMAYLG